MLLVSSGDRLKKMLPNTAQTAREIKWYPIHFLHSVSSWYLPNIIVPLATEANKGRHKSLNGSLVVLDVCCSTAFFTLKFMLCIWRTQLNLNGEAFVA